MLWFNPSPQLEPCSRSLTSPSLDGGKNSFSGTEAQIQKGAEKVCCNAYFYVTVSVHPWFCLSSYSAHTMHKEQYASDKNWSQFTEYFLANVKTLGRMFKVPYMKFSLTSGSSVPFSAPLGNCLSSCGVLLSCTLSLEPSFKTWCREVSCGGVFYNGIPELKYCVFFYTGLRIDRKDRE